MSHTVYISAIIHAPLEQVWPMFRDFNGLAGWHPGVAVSRLEDGGRADALGSVRHLTLQPSGPMFRDFNGLAGWHPGVAVSRLEDGGRADALGSVRHLTPSRPASCANSC